MTFFTVCDAMYEPPVARESTATITPPWYLKANVVVPRLKAILTAESGLLYFSKNDFG